MKKRIYNYAIPGVSIILMVLILSLIALTNAIKHTSYDGFYGFLGGVIGGIATLITIFISTYLTLKVQDESNKFDIKKIRIGIQVEAVQTQRIFITEVRIKYSDLYSFIIESYNEIEDGASMNVSLPMLELKYGILGKAINDLEKHFRDNEYILVKLYDHYSKLDKMKKKIISYRDKIKETNNSDKLRFTLYDTADMLRKGELYTWLNDLEILMTDKYMSGVLEEEETDKIKDNIHKWYH